MSNFKIRIVDRSAWVGHELMMILGSETQQDFRAGAPLYLSAKDQGCGCPSLSMKRVSPGPLSRVWECTAFRVNEWALRIAMSCGSTDRTPYTKHGYRNSDKMDLAPHLQLMG